MVWFGIARKQFVNSIYEPRGLVSDGKVDSPTVETSVGVLVFLLTDFLCCRAGQLIRGDVPGDLKSEVEVRRDPVQKEVEPAQFQLCCKASRALHEVVVFVECACVGQPAAGQVAVGEDVNRSAIAAAVVVVFVTIVF